MTAQIVHIDLITGAAWLPWMLMAVHALTEPGRTGPAARDRGAGGPAAPAVVAVLAALPRAHLLSGGAEAIIDSGVWCHLRHRTTLTTGLLGRTASSRPAVGGRPGRGAGRRPALGAAQWIPGARLHLPVPTGHHHLRLLHQWIPADQVVTLIASPFVLGTNQSRPGHLRRALQLPRGDQLRGSAGPHRRLLARLRRYRTRPEARHWWVWYVTLGVGLLSALGGQTPFGRLCTDPGISDERLLSRNLLLVDFSLAVLLAWWMHLLARQRAEPVPTGPRRCPSAGDGAGGGTGGDRRHLPPLAVDGRPVPASVGDGPGSDRSWTSSDA